MSADCSAQVQSFGRSIMKYMKILHIPFKVIRIMAVLLSVLFLKKPCHTIAVVSSTEFDLIIAAHVIHFRKHNESVFVKSKLQFL